MLHSLSVIGIADGFHRFYVIVLAAGYPREGYILLAIYVYTHTIKGMSAFDPKKFDFVKLKNFTYPGGVSVYEYKNHATVDGVPNFLRLNLYLSKDGDFVTIWFGLIEPLFTEARLKSVKIPSCFDLGEQYTEGLFRGYIDSQEGATYILKALRVGTPKGYTRPQILSANADNKLECNFIEAI